MRGVSKTGKNLSKTLSESDASIRNLTGSLSFDKQSARWRN